MGWGGILWGDMDVEDNIMNIHTKQSANQPMIPTENRCTPQFNNQLSSFSTIPQAHWASQAKVELIRLGVCYLSGIKTRRKGRAGAIG